MRDIVWIISIAQAVGIAASALPAVGVVAVVVGASRWAQVDTDIQIIVPWCNSWRYIKCPVPWPRKHTRTANKLAGRQAQRRAHTLATSE